MNSKNKILVGCLALLLALSVGYALFSDTITINGTATAKGSFNITATCEVVTEENATTNESNVTTIGGTGNCQIDDTITTTSNLTKPTDMVYYRVTYENKGTIPSLLKSVNSSNNASHINSNGVIEPGDEMYVNEYYVGAYYGALSEENFSGFSDSAVADAKVVLHPNEKMTVYIAHRWFDSTRLSQPELPEEGVTINYNVTALFEQVSN